jgi:hypothetical protein
VSLIFEEPIAGDSMSTISVKEIERNRSKTTGLNRVSVPSAKNASANCDGQEPSTSHYPRKAQRRQQCATVPNIFVTAQPSVARSVTANLASSDTTPGEPPSAQKGALTASRHARMATADGYLGFKPLDNGCSENPAAFLRRSGFRSKEAIQ